MVARSNKKKYIIIGSIIVVVLLVILAVTKKKTSHEIDITAELPVKRTIIETVSANGKIQPEKDIKISPYISGEVVNLYVKEGDEVNKGDLLAKIDPEIYKTNYEQIEASLQMQRANLANSKARLAQAQAQFVRAEEDFKRNNKLFEQNVISQSDFETATSAYKVSQAEVSAAEENVKAAEFSVSSSEATLREAGENLNRTAIYAPNDGTVSRLSIEQGERVTGASQFSSGTEIMRIANLERMIVVVEVNENDIVRVNLNDTCIIEVDAYLDHKFKGLVTEMATSANVLGVSADQVTNFEVKILILEDSYKDLLGENSIIRSPFRPGMSATVDIQTETALDILTVPIQAVTTRADTTGKESQKVADEKENDIAKEKDELIEVVFVLEEGKAKMHKVKTGIQDNTFIEITEGITEDQEVITGPYRAVSKKLNDGDDVKKVDKKDLFKDEE
ncbi:MAG: efflux RND transporter periplasmic adaptor subunit [Bacteroidales bacterium]|nr:efflux RND transporter periplasmic adaptor subunit [Bacteroidales bacterium]MCF8402305.1 efflux RND transporter periplasmic adaptor subunit [Bacteroidales bacterium]